MGRVPPLLPALGLEYCELELGVLYEHKAFGIFLTHMFNTSSVIFFYIKDGILILEGSYVLIGSSLVWFRFSA